MSARGSSYRQLLNNELQPLGRLESLKYEYTSRGPLHDPVWEAVANIDGEEYGRGEGHSRADAKEAAAMNAWLRFRRRHGA